MSSVIVEDLSSLYVLSLPSTPAAETMEKVGEVWISAIAGSWHDWDEQQDRNWLEHAFARLTADAGRWPSPKMLIERIAPRAIFITAPQNGARTFPSCFPTALGTVFVCAYCDCAKNICQFKVNTVVSSCFFTSNEG